MNRVYEEILATYNSTLSIRKTAKDLRVSQGMVRKVLLTFGVYANDRSQEIAELRVKGMSTSEIAATLRVSIATVNANSPYDRGTYKTPSNTRLAMYMRRWHQLNRQKILRKLEVERERNVPDFRWKAKHTLPIKVRCVF